MTCNISGIALFTVFARCRPPNAEIGLNILRCGSCRPDLAGGAVRV
jgi:hypothetical protein